MKRTYVTSFKHGYMCLLFTVLFVLCALTYRQTQFNSNSINKLIEYETIHTQVVPDFMFTNPKEGMMDAIEFFITEDSVIRNIIWCQYVLESNHGDSRLAREEHNLFGLYDSKHKKYFTFTNWQESVVMYNNLVFRKYDSSKENYLDFLRRIRYAEDMNKYINTLKQVYKKHFNEIDLSN